MSGPRASRGNTDPGIAPPADPLPLPRHPVGIVVPPVVPSLVAPNDSIDILLEGISRDQPDRPRTTPQTDGQAAATYHAEHPVRAARTSPDDQPKVVIDRPPLDATVRLDRVRRPEAEAATTIVSSQPLLGRITVGVVAGLVVVAVIFAALERSAGFRTAAAGHETPNGMVDPKPTTDVVPTVVLDPLPAARSGVADPDVPASPPGAPAVGADPGSEALGLAASRASKRPVPAAWVAKPVRPSSRPVAPTPNVKGGDLGEFKTSL